MKSYNILLSEKAHTDLRVMAAQHETTIRDLITSTLEAVGNVDFPKEIRDGIISRAWSTTQYKRLKSRERAKKTLNPPPA